MGENLPAATTGVLDEDSNEFVTISQEMRVEALAVDGQVQYHWQSGHLHLVGLGLALKEMAHGRLYLAMGFRSFEAYTQKHFGRGRQWAYERMAIAEKLRAAGVDPVRTCGQFPTHSQLRAAIALDNADFGSLIAGTLALPSGETKPLKDMTVRETAEVVAWRTKAETAEREAAETKRQLAEERSLRVDSDRRFKKAQEQKEAEAAKAQVAQDQATKLGAENEQLRNRPPKVVRDPAADKTIAQMGQEIARLRAELAKPDQAQAKLDEITRRLAEVQPLYDKQVAAQESALGVNQAVSRIMDAATHARGVIETAVGRQFPDAWLELGTIKDCLGIMDAISRDLRRIVKDSTPTTIDA